MKKRVTVILTLIAMCTIMLTGCGTPSLEGRWEICGMEIKGEKVLFEDAKDMIETIAKEEDMEEEKVEEMMDEAEEKYEDSAVEFLEDGICYAIDGEDILEAEWEEEEDDIIITFDGNELEGKIEDDLLVIEGEDMALYFEKTEDEVEERDLDDQEDEDSEKEPVTEPTETPTEEPVEVTEKPTEEPIMGTTSEYVGTWFPSAIDYEEEKCTFDGLREEMIQMLIDNGMSEEEAIKAAEESLETSLEAIESIHFVFNEDGTVSANAMEETKKGTWTTTDSGIDVTIDGDTQEFIYDGTELKMENDGQVIYFSKE